MSLTRDIVICGSGPSLFDVDFTDRSVEYWTVGSLHHTLGDDIDLYFCLHGDDPHEKAIPDTVNQLTQESYPLEEIYDKYKSKYFTSSIAYMIAYAIYCKVDSIRLEGIGLDYADEYMHQKPAVAYWLGRAEGEGIKVSWIKLTPPFLYGYEGKEVGKFLAIMNAKYIMAKRELAATKIDQEKDQWIGFMYALDTLAKELKG